jgi:hypothetical protein
MVVLKTEMHKKRGMEKMGKKRLIMLILMKIKNKVLRAIDFGTEVILNLQRSSAANSCCQRKMFE